MLTNSKYKVFKGVINSLINKIQGYPTASILREFTINTFYKIDLKNRTLSPNLKLSPQKEKILLKVFEWFDHELIKKKINHSEILKCAVEISISKVKLLFIPYNKYLFNTILTTSFGKHIKSNIVNGWL